MKVSPMSPEDKERLTKANPRPTWLTDEAAQELVYRMSQVLMAAPDEAAESCSIFMTLIMDNLGLDEVTMAKISIGAMNKMHDNLTDVGKEKMDEVMKAQTGKSFKEFQDDAYTNMVTKNIN